MTRAPRFKAQTGGEADMTSYDYSGQARPEHMHYTNQAHPQDGYGYPDDMYDQEQAPPQAGAALGRVVNMLGAAASLALVAGIGVWGYKLVMRDVSGVPVVRAAEGPMRIQPENPGGTPADHQGLAVNAVAAVGTAAAPADRLILAPRPVSLTEEDVPTSVIEPTAAVHLIEEPVTDQQAAQLRQGIVDSVVADLTDQGTEPTQDQGVQLASLATPDDEPAIDPVDLAAQLPDPALAALPGVRRSLRPLTRPARAIPSGIPASSGTEAAINAAVKAAVGLDLDPDGLTKGTRLAQLGAYESTDVAQAEWVRLSGQFGEYMNGKQRVIQKTSSGGRTFYRLRVHGFDDVSDSRQFCAALVAQGADCIPVAAR